MRKFDTQTNLYDPLNTEYFTGDKRRNKFHGESIKSSSSERRIISLTTSHDMIFVRDKREEFFVV